VQERNVGSTIES